MSATVEPEEMMTVVAARELRDETVCFVGIGLPSTAANLARLTHAPRTVLVYESGTIGSKPATLPLVGFLGAAQIDRFGNLNSTVIGDYDAPKVRLPGGGGAPEIAALAREVIVIIRQSTRTFVEQLHFRSSVGYGSGQGDRERLGFSGQGPTTVITDLGVLRPDPETCELTLTEVHPGVTVDEELRVLRELRATLQATAA